MFLVFVTKAGSLYDGQHLYELMFCKNAEDAFQLGASECHWLSKPANSRPTPLDNAGKVCYFLSSVDLVLVKDSNVFSIEDAKDGIIPLAYSDEKLYNERLKLTYGQHIEQLSADLYAKGISIKEAKDIFI